MPMGAPIDKRHCQRRDRDPSRELGTWMARICLSNDIDGESTDGCNRNIVRLVGGKGGHGGRCQREDE